MMLFVTSPRIEIQTRAKRGQLCHILQAGNNRRMDQQLRKSQYLDVPFELAQLTAIETRLWRSCSFRLSSDFSCSLTAFCSRWAETNAVVSSNSWRSSSSLSASSLRTVVSFGVISVSNLMYCSSLFLREVSSVVRALFCHLSSSQLGIWLSVFLV
eukprot:15907_1